MCGIVGALAGQPIDATVLERMRDRLAHRGPDHAGLWLSADREVGLGHRRLAVIDLNPEANQPFRSTDERFTLTFNGEIYNFRDLRRELEAEGIAFRTSSDTEVLVEAYRRWGAGCLERLSGMFAFALWDAGRRELFCARDRAGEKPFHYGVYDGTFLFASELKALVEWPSFRREICYPALIDFLTFGCVADPRTIWEGCRKLPPGHWLKVRKQPGGPPEVGAPREYWDFRFHPDLRERDWSDRILDTLTRAAKEMSFADVPVGSFLSGGVDSSSVTAALTKSGSDVTAFTIGFDDQDHDERRWAREVVERYGTPHVERTVRAEDVLSVFRRMVWHFDEPFNDYSYLPTFYLCREARRSITVALSGDGGDEAFAGYAKYRRLAVSGRLDRLMPGVGRPLLAGLARLLPRETGPAKTLRQHGRPVQEMLTDMMLVGFKPAELREVARGPLRDALRHHGPADTVGPLLRRASPSEVGLIDAMRYVDMKVTLAGGILVKVDRASMAVSLEVRPVYLHRDLLDLAGAIPSGLLADPGHSKEALKSALRAWLPEPLLYRPKQGFALPLARWFRDEPGLAASVWQGVEAGPLAELFDLDRLRRRVRPEHSDRGNTAALLHALLFLRAWLDEWR